MATKVGEGYIEIKPRLVGFNRDLLRDARRAIREAESVSKEAVASLTVKPKISGITKVWQTEIQRELNAKIKGLTVDVKVKLENGLKVTFGDFAIDAKDAGEKAGDGLAKGFKKYIGDVHKEINKANIAIKSGFKAPDDSGIRDTVGLLGDEFKELAQDIDNFSDQEVKAIARAVSSHKTLNDQIGRETNKAAKEFEQAFESNMRNIDRMTEKLTNQRVLADTKGAWNLARSLNDEIKEAENIADSLFPDLTERVAKHGQKGGSTFSSAFGKALRANFLDNASEGLLGLAGKFAVAAVSAQPLLGALSNLSAGLIELGTIAVDLYGSFLALPAVWAAVAQAGAVLTAAFWGVSEALTAVQNETQHAAANAAVQARQISAAQEQVADAKERLARAVESANESITRAEESVSEAMLSAARQIADAQARVTDAQSEAAEAVERASERIADAQEALSRAYESAADRVASAESRHVDSIRRVRDAQLDLNDAYKEAYERFEDLNIAMGNSILDEEGAQIAIDRAKERLDEITGDPKSSDLDKREAKHAYEEAIQRLQEIQERQGDLKKEIDEANRSGVEGSKEVTDAKQKLLDAQKAEIEAQAEIAKAHKDASREIQEAQERLASAWADAVKAQLDGAERIQEAERALADARAEGAKDVQNAQKDLAKAHQDSARTIADSQKDVQRAIQNLTEAQTKQNEQFFNAQYALSQLSPEAQKFVHFLADSFLPKLKEVQFAIQDAFFPPIQRALEQSGGLLALFEGKLAITAGIFGNLIGKTIEWLETPETMNSLGRILDTNNRLFELLGPAAINFGDALLAVIEGAGPFLEAMGKLVLDFSQWVSDIATSEEGRNELKVFFENVAETVQKVLDVAALVGGALFRVYELARPYGQDLLDDIKDIAKEFSDWVNSTEGETQIEKFLKNGRNFLSETFKLVKAVAKAFFEFGAGNDLSGVITSIKDDLLPSILNVIDAFGGGNGGGGFIFFIKAVSVALNLMAGNISLVSAGFSLITGDVSGARDSFADFMDSVSGSMTTVFGDVLPNNFGSATRAFNDSVRGMEPGRDKLNLGFDQMGNNAIDWSNLTETHTNLTETNFNDMANNVGGNMSRYRDDVDGKTKDAKAKADQNTKDTKESVLKHMDDMRRENEVQMEKYRKTVDTKTIDAKTASTRNIGDLVKDVRNVMLPFSSVFETAAREAQAKLKQPGGGTSWWDVGLAIIDGLWKGLKDMIPNFLTSVWNLGVDIVNTIRKALDSNSPSKKMMAVGRDTGEGLVLGIESMSGKVSRASKKLAGSVTDAFGIPSLDVDMGTSGRKVVPTIGPADASGLTGAGRVYNISVTAAPTIPTEKQISNVLKYQEALYE